MVPVRLLHYPETFAPAVGMLNFHPFAAKFLVLSFLLFRQFAILWLLVRDFAVVVYLVNALVSQVALDPHLSLYRQGCLIEYSQVRLSPLRFDLTMQNGTSFLIFNQLNLDNMFFL